MLTIFFFSLFVKAVLFLLGKELWWVYSIWQIRKTPVLILCMLRMFQQITSYDQRVVYNMAVDKHCYSCNSCINYIVLSINVDKNLKPVDKSSCKDTMKVIMLYTIRNISTAINKQKCVDTCINIQQHATLYTSLM